MGTINTSGSAINMIMQAQRAVIEATIYLWKRNSKQDLDLRDYFIIKHVCHRAIVFLLHVFVKNNEIPLDISNQNVL